MLRGERVGLRARRESDIAILLAELHNDVATRCRADSRPWVPVSPEDKNQPYDVNELPAGMVCFSVVELTSDELVGDALLWGVDVHNRLAHIGLSLRPRFRGQGLAKDIISVLCHYGFAVRGFNRLQIDTLGDNEPMKRTALATGFTLEATHRRSAWVMGDFVDEVAYGLLVDEWVS